VWRRTRSLVEIIQPCEAYANEHDPRYTWDWIDEHLSDDEREYWCQWACTHELECATDYARELWGNHVTVHTEGRSGGWAIVDGLNQDVDTWDAIAFSKWQRFERYCAALVDDTLYQYATLIYFNVFEPWVTEQAEIDSAELYHPIAQ